MRERSRKLLAMAVLALLAMTPIASSAQAETWPDAYTQIVNHQIPVQHDGAPSYFWFGWGRYYTGPNGLEVRLTNSGTGVVIQTVLALESAGASQVITGTISSLGSVVLSGVAPNTLRNALTYAGVGLSQGVSDAINQLALRNLCLGVTVPNAGLDSTLNRAFSLMGAQYVQAFKGPYYNDLKVWFETCTTSPTAGQADIRIPLSLPGVANVVAAQPIAPAPPAPLPRMAFIDSRGSEFRANDDTAWQFSSDASVAPTAVAVDSQRMGLINSASGALFRRNDAEGWTQIVGPSFQPKAVAVSDSGRMAFIDNRGAWYRPNDNSAWVSMSDASVSPTAVSVSGQRMGLINSSSGALFRLNDNSPWVQIVGPSFHPRKVVVSDTGRMAFIDDRGAWFRPNDNSAWQMISDASVNPTDISISGTRVGLVNSASGAIFRTSDSGPWVQIVDPSFGPTAVAVSG
jgi:photosystem II stability/assembly factor-like uncharacterized protein